MTAEEASIIIEHAICKVQPGVHCIRSPLADGGEGSMNVLVNATRGKIFSQTVKGPLGNDIQASYAILGDGKTAVVEMAAASGLQLVPVEKRNPLITTSYGTGQLIKAALQHNINKLLITIGGSATNDGGAGMLQALGVALSDKEGNQIAFGGGALSHIESIDITNFLLKQYPGISIEVACDVNNPLTGLNGASAVYGPQKGADLEAVQQLDANLKHYAKKIKDFLGTDIETIPGAGAAGGIGAALIAFFNANLVNGAKLIIQYTGIEAHIANADLVITGEGSIDKQTIFGKAIYAIKMLAAKYNKPVIAFAGKVSDVDILENMGLLKRSFAKRKGKSGESGW